MALGKSRRRRRFCLHHSLSGLLPSNMFNIAIRFLQTTKTVDTATTGEEAQLSEAAQAEKRPTEWANWKRRPSSLFHWVENGGTQSIWIEAGGVQCCKLCSDSHSRGWHTMNVEEKGGQRGHTRTKKLSYSRG